VTFEEVKEELLPVVITEEVVASPIVEPAPEPTPIPEPEDEPTPIPEPEDEPTPIPEPEDEPTPQPKVVKPWEVIRPMPPTNPNAWQRGQKWRP
jgi:periplasmic protein TonB